MRRLLGCSLALLLGSTPACTGTGEVANADTDAEASPPEREAEANPTELSDTTDPSDTDAPDSDTRSGTATDGDTDPEPTPASSDAEDSPSPPSSAVPDPTSSDSPAPTPADTRAMNDPSDVTVPSSDAGAPSDSGDGFFGDSRCSTDFLLCEDFESGEIDPARWSIRGSVSVGDEHAARGARAALFHTEGNGLAMLTNESVFPVAGNSYYARAFVRFSELPTAPMWAHWTISGAEGSQTDAEIRVGGQWDGQTNRFGVGTDHGPTGDWTHLDNDPAGAPLPVPAFEWVCLEWHNDGTTHESYFWWNEQEHPSLHTSSSEHGGSDDEYLLPQFESIWFGWWLYQADPQPDAYDVWIDEIVIDDEPIGCTR